MIIEVIITTTEEEHYLRSSKFQSIRELCILWLFNKELVSYFGSRIVRFLMRESKNSYYWLSTPR